MNQKVFEFITPNEIVAFKRKALRWANQFTPCCYLDSNQYPVGNYRTYEGLIAVGQTRSLTASAGNAFLALEKFYTQASWLFGFLTYDLKNELEKLQSNQIDRVGLPDLFFFEPEHLILIHTDRYEIISHTEKAENIQQQIQQFTFEATTQKTFSFEPLEPLKSNTTHYEYLTTVKDLQTHIEEGTMYELNYCIEFYAKVLAIDPVTLFQMLNAKAKAPFSAFCKFSQHYVLCNSPERFLKKEGNTLISQPIKGTIKRGLSPIEDEQLQQQLLNDPKERAENVMIVDLVRNDLTKSAQFGTIKVSELFGLYPFETVHHLVSTVTAQIRPEFSPIEAIRNAFPMGSMTGAPKIMSMELIEQYEKSKRGLYSGAIGYFTPTGDFDFNVVIRSLFYNIQTQMLSLKVGSAITYDSNPQREYEECLLKAQLFTDWFSECKAC